MSAEFIFFFFFCNSRMFTESHCHLVITHFGNLISKSCLLTTKQIPHTMEASSLSVTYIHSEGVYQ